jgi:hypothetical protein
MMVVVVWDKIINSWGYIFKEAPSTFNCVKCLRQLSTNADEEQKQPQAVLCACGHSNVPPRSRAANKAITSKVWTERKLRKLFYRLRKQPQASSSSSATAGNDDAEHDDVKHDAPPSDNDAGPKLEKAAESSDSEVEEMVSSIEEQPSQDPAPVEMVDPVMIDVVDPVNEAPIEAESKQLLKVESGEASAAEAAPAEAGAAPAEAGAAPASPAAEAVLAAPAVTPAEAVPAIEAAAENDLVIVEQQPFEEGQASLCAMGFVDRDRNLPLLREHSGDVNAVVNALLA